MEPRMVSARSDRHQIIRESFDAIWTDGMRSDHHAQVVSLEE